MLPQLIRIIKNDPFVIIESNWVLKFIHPDLYLIVLKYGVEEFKDSAKQTLEQADAALVLNSDAPPPAWQGIVLDVLEGVPVYKAAARQNMPDGLVDFIQSRLSKP